MKSCVSLIFFTCIISAAAKAQDSTQVVNSFATLRDSDSRMNSMKVERQLIQKLYNTPNGHDAYQLRGGMICLVPDSTIAQKLVIAKPTRRY